MKTKQTLITKKRFFEEAQRQRAVLRTVVTNNGQYKENREQWIEEKTKELLKQGYPRNHIYIKNDKFLHFGSSFIPLNNYSKHPQELPINITAYRVVIGTSRSERVDYKPINENSVMATYNWGTVTLSLLY